MVKTSQRSFPAPRSFFKITTYFPTSILLPLTSFKIWVPSSPFLNHFWFRLLAAVSNDA